MNKDFVPNVGSMYRFPTGIRIVLTAPQDGKVKVALPNIRLNAGSDMVQVREDGSIFTYPGISYLEVSTINREYKLTGVLHTPDDRTYGEYETIVLKTPVKKKRKKK